MTKTKKALPSGLNMNRKITSEKSMKELQGPVIPKYLTFLYQVSLAKDSETEAALPRISSLGFQMSTVLMLSSNPLTATSIIVRKGLLNLEMYVEQTRETPTQTTKKL